MATVINSPEKIEELVVNNMKLVYWAAHRWSDNMAYLLNFDDKVSVLTMGLFKAARVFDESRGYDFITLALRCMDNAKNDYYKTSSIFAIPASEVVFTDPGIGGDEFYENIEEPDALFEIENIADRITLGILVGRLPQLEQKVLHMRYYKEMTQLEVSTALGHAQPYISKIEKRAINKLKQVLMRR